MILLDIESLFGDTYPHASFHDATINKISVDWLERVLTLDCKIFVGNPDDREAQPRKAFGQLIFTELFYVSIEPPGAGYPDGDKGLWIAYDGPVETTEFNGLKPALPEPLPPDAFAHCFFINNWNSYMFVAATGARFEWY